MNMRIEHPCGGCDMFAASVWQPVATPSLALLARRFARRNLAAGETLFQQGSECRGLFCLSQGLLAQRRHNPDGSATMLRLVQPGEVVGLRAFLRRAPHRTEIRAVLPSRVCSVDRATAQGLVKASPGVLARLAERCLREVDHGQDRIVQTDTHASRDRMAALLSGLLNSHGRPTGDRLSLTLPLSRADLADLVGIRPETASRVLGRLRREAPFEIEAGRRRVTVSAPL
jgi:CRP-like cAMP-binding protein